MFVSCSVRLRVVCVSVCTYQELPPRGGGPYETPHTHAVGGESWWLWLVGAGGSTRSSPIVLRRVERERRGEEAIWLGVVSHRCLAAGKKNRAPTPLDNVW
jgi:hypothetical protein